MNQKFSRKELERLGCKEEEIRLVMDYQKKLPVIVDNDEIQKYCVDAKILHEQLESKRQFTDWLNNRIKSYKFIENVDFSTFSHNHEIANTGGYKPITSYILILDMAKQLSMIEKTEIGALARRYFILMENLVRDNKEWWETRNPEKKDYNDMCEALSNNIYRHTGRTADKYDYSCAANILNIIATGSEAQSIRLYFGIHNKSDLTRDSLEKDYNEKLSFLQKQNIIYLGLNMPILERVKLLIASFDVIYPNAQPVIPSMNREKMLKNREDLIKRLEI